MPRRRMVLGGAAAGLIAYSAPAPAADHGGLTLWFDPTQLPSYSGRLDRWVANPAGEIDRGIFREGTQFLFPSAEAEALMAATERGGPLAVWGIRARTAPVVMMLAWARTDSDAANFVERPAWFANMASGRDELTLTGRILAPMLNPQGEPMGVILAEGGAIRLTTAMHKQLASRLGNGETISAQGPGTQRGEFAAIDARRIGRDPSSLEGLPEPRP
ncbi:hypothetical protein [Roseococcus sp. YIM B11640]|uniref:hypothetical protein n=1 Tax=Roseococcus sp. YIM B11640 TaxID=3133973 RepID=UPI003C7A28D5